MHMHTCTRSHMHVCITYMYIDNMVYRIVKNFGGKMFGILKIQSNVPDNHTWNGIAQYSGESCNTEHLFWACAARLL